MYDVEPSGIMRRDLRQRRQRALVALHRDHPRRAGREQRPRQPAGAGADLDDRPAVQRTGGARDPRGEVEVKQEILAERFACRQIMPLDDLAQRRQIVDLAHGAGLARAIRAARRSAAIRLEGLARLLPAMSKAVP